MGDPRNPPVSDFCLAEFRGPCPPFSKVKADALADSRAQWMARGECAGAEEGSWSGGSSLSRLSGTCVTSTWFDRSGTMELAMSGCAYGRVRQYGWTLHDPFPTRAVGHPLCDDARTTLRLAGGRLEATYGQLSLDGAELCQAPRCSAEVGLGTHRLSLGKRSAPLTLASTGHQLLVTVGAGLTTRQDGERVDAGTTLVLSAGVGKLKISSDDEEDELEILPWLVDAADGGT